MAPRRLHRGRALPRMRIRSGENADTFCSDGGCRGDWILPYVTVPWLPAFWKVRFLKCPAFFTLETGTHHKKTCSPTTQNSRIEPLLNNNKQYMFPETLSVRSLLWLPFPHPGNRGGGVLGTMNSVKAIEDPREKSQLQKQK